MRRFLISTAAILYLVRELLLCRWCTDVIGVYEPMVVLDSGESRETSVLNEPPGEPVGDCYHRACFDESMRRAAGTTG
jgi:hypothetical protein